MATHRFRIEAIITLSSLESKRIYSRKLTYLIIKIVNLAYGRNHSTFPLELLNWFWAIRSTGYCVNGLGGVVALFIVVAVFSAYAGFVADWSGSSWSFWKKRIGNGSLVLLCCSIISLPASLLVECLRSNRIFIEATEIAIAWRTRPRIHHLVRFHILRSNLVKVVVDIDAAGEAILFDQDLWLLYLSWPGSIKWNITHGLSLSNWLWRVELGHRFHSKWHVHLPPSG